MQYLKTNISTQYTRSMPLIGLVFIFTLFLQGCASDRDLFAQYDKLGCSQVCESIISAAPYSNWHLSIYFTTDSYQLTKAGQQKLEENLLVLQQQPNYHVLVRGFTDLRASQQYNLTLSQKRTEAVLNYFIQQNVAQNRLLLQSPFGETRPIKLKQTKAALQENRRVEMILVEKNGRFIPMQSLKNNLPLPLPQ